MSTAARIGAPGLPPALSFEMFPPRSATVAATVGARLSMLTGLRPEYISVTYGAAGSGPERSREMLATVLRHPHVPAMAHLTCTGQTRAELTDRIVSWLRAGVRNVLALRGDPPAGETDWRPATGGLDSAAELVTLIREIEVEARTGLGPDGDALLAPGERISVSVAAYPSAASRPREVELRLLARKQAAGADFAITQVFHDAEDYIGLLAEARAAGITLPIMPGILPYADLRRLDRLEELSGVPTPEHLHRHLDLPDPDQRRKVGARCTLDLATAVLDGGAPGIHLYTFNELHAVDEVSALVRARPALDAPRPLQGAARAT